MVRCSLATLLLVGGHCASGRVRQDASWVARLAGHLGVPSTVLRAATRTAAYQQLA